MSEISENNLNFETFAHACAQSHVSWQHSTEEISFEQLYIMDINYLRKTRYFPLTQLLLDVIIKIVFHLCGFHSHLLMNKNFIKTRRLRKPFNRSRVGVRRREWVSEKKKKEAQQLLIINFKRVGKKEGDREKANKFKASALSSALMNEKCELNN